MLTVIQHPLTQRIDMERDPCVYIAREKQLKAWRRDWKTALIDKQNFFWADLALTLGFEPLA